MKKEVSQNTPVKKRYLASIDMGSHTARFLVSQIVDTPQLFLPVERKRHYTNLAYGFNQEDAGVISENGVKTAVNAVVEFYEIARNYNVEKIAGAATGIFRRAENSRVLLNEIKKRTGIEINTVSGEEEAFLTLKGVIHALKLKDPPDVFFDLGGSTTEIICRTGDKSRVVSVPVGAFVLTDMFIRHDPPLAEEIAEIEHYVSGVLEKNISRVSVNIKDAKIIGSGGTATSIAAIIRKLDVKGVTPDVLNGSSVSTDQLSGLYEELKTMPFPERLGIKSIDEGRAKVILAGTAAVFTILKYFNAKSFTVSYSDILEGLIISYLKGDRDEQNR